MANNVNVTPGSGVVVTSDQITSDSSQAQIVKLAISADNDRTKIPATAANGMTVDVTRVQGNVTVQPLSGQVFPINDNGGSITIDDGGNKLTVDALKTSPVATRLSDGADWIASLPVSGTVTANQGTAAAAASGWPVKLTDGTNTAGLSTVGSDHAVKVDVIQSVGGGSDIADNSAFTEGTTEIGVIGGEYNDSPSGPTSGQVAAVRITSKRALHVNVRKNDGTELGIAATPLRTDPTGTTTQPVSQAAANWTVDLNKVGGDAVAKVGTGIQKVAVTDSTGAAINAASPLVTTHKGQGETRVTKSVALSASQTAAALWTPASGKKFYIRKIVLVVTTAGPLTIFDGTNAAANMVADSGGAVNWPTGVFSLDYNEPWASSTADNVLKYTSGSGLVGVLTVHGYEA